MRFRLTSSFRNVPKHTGQVAVEKAESEEADEELDEVKAEAVAPCARSRETPEEVEGFDTRG